VSTTPQPPAIHHVIPRRLFIAVVAVLPAVVFLASSVLQYGLDISGAATWMDPLFDTTGLRLLAIGVVLLGPAMAAVLALSWLLPLRWTRNEDAWELRIRVRVDPVAIAIFLVALACGAILYGHIAAENAACLIGLASRC
jgi:hypothetical protein